MKNLLKKLSCMVLIVGVVIGCCACSTNSSKAYTFKVDTGDQVKVELNTADGYDITSDLPFVISKDNKTLSQGTFITADDYDSMKHTSISCGITMMRNMIMQFTSKILKQVF